MDGEDFAVSRLAGSSEDAEEAAGRCVAICKILLEFSMSETGTAASGAPKNEALQYVSDALNDLRAKGVAPKLRVLEGEQKAICTFDGREVINLASNNYLGLASNKALRKASIEAVRTL